MCTIILEEDESIDHALRRFHFKVRQAGIIEAARRGRHFESRQEKQKRKQATAKRRKRRSRA